MKVEDVIIIGAGPAGIATAIQLKRSGLGSLLLEKNHIGGLLVNANLVENYPGFPEGISGTKLAGLFRSQLEKVGQEVSFEEVIQLDYGDNFTIQTSKRNLRSRIVVIASGTKPKEIDIPVAAEDRVFHDVRPIIGVEGKKVVIIGAGDAAFDYALNLGRKNEVVILNRGENLKCLPLLWKRANRLPGIAYQQNSSVRSIESAGNGLILSYENPLGGWELRADYAIFAIGRRAQLDYLAQGLKERTVELEESGLLYFVGDVKNDIYRQTSIAVGDGVHAAMKIYRKLWGSD